MGVPIDIGTKTSKCSSSLQLFLMLITATIGMGKLWKFPYLVAEYGGLFIIVYIVCLCFITAPLLYTELFLGRYQTLHNLRCPSLWRKLKVLLVITSIIILSYYSMLAGWVFAYIPRAFGGLFHGQSNEGIAAIFYQLISDPERVLAWYTLFIIITILFSVQGLQKGLEVSAKIITPFFLLFLASLVGYAWKMPVFTQVLDHLFSLHWEQFDQALLLSAMSQALFSFCLGMGIMLIYGSYTSIKMPLSSLLLGVISVDIIVMISITIVVFSLLFSMHVPLQHLHSDFLFQHLPFSFGQLAGGSFFSGIFFLMLLLAAWGTAIALLEPSVVWVMHKYNFLRSKAVVVVAIIVWIFGLVNIFAFNIWSQITLTLSYSTHSGILLILNESNIFSVLERFVSIILLPINALFLVIIMVRGVFKVEAINMKQMKNTQGILFYQLWSGLITYIVPGIIVLFFLHETGLFSFLSYTILPWFNEY